MITLKVNLVYYYGFKAHWTLSGMSWVSQYRKVKPGR